MSQGAIPTPDPNSLEWNIYIDSQSFNLTALDGSQTTLTLSMINSLTAFNVRSIAVQGFALGFSSLLIIVLLLLTTAKKARRTIFIFNFLCLLLLCIRSIFNISIICTQRYYGVGENFLNAIAQYPIYKSAVNIVAVFMSLFLNMAITTSLVLQVRVAFSAEPRTQKLVTTSLSLLALWIVAMYTHYLAIFIEVEIYRTSPPVPWTFKSYEISMIVMIGISCFLFLYKLFGAIHLRRRMGYKNFGPLQILFVMSAQCLVIPVIIYILDYNISQIQALENLGQAFLVVSLPLSALWASHVSEQSSISRKALSNVSEKSSGVAQKFRVLGRSKDKNHKDVEKSSSVSETSTNSVEKEKGSIGTTKDTLSS